MAFIEMLSTALVSKVTKLKNVQVNTDACMFSDSIDLKDFWFFILNPIFQNAIISSVCI